MSKQKLIVLATFGMFGLAAVFATLLVSTSAQELAPSNGGVPDAKIWEAVAPGRVEPWSEQIRIGSPVVGRVGQVQVTVNDTVFAGEALIRIDNDDVRTNLAKVEAGVNLRKRARANPPASKDAPRRNVEDAAANAEQAVIEARSAVDRAAVARRAGTKSDDALKTATAALSSKREQLNQRRDELAKFEADTPSIVPTELEGKLTIALIDLGGAQAALDNLTIRAPIAGTVLQLGVRVGELASPSAPQPLVVLGDLSKLHVRAELDQRDYGATKTGQSVLVRLAHFPVAISLARFPRSRRSSDRAALAREDRAISQILMSRMWWLN